MPRISPIVKLNGLITFPGPVNDINSHVFTMQICIYFTNRYKDVFQYSVILLGLNLKLVLPLKSLGPV